MKELTEKEWLEPKCVRIWKGNSQDPANYRGSGFLITRRHILTAAHVVKDVSQDELIVTGRAWGSNRTVREGPHYPESVGPRDLRRDVAVLGLSLTEQTSEEPLPFANDTFLDNTQHQPVTIGGFADPSSAGLKVKSLDKENYHDPTDSIVAAGHSESGMSGGPAIREGKVIGIVYASSESKHKTYIVPLAGIRNFLDQYLPTAKPDYSRQSVSRLSKGEAKKWVIYLDRNEQIDDLALFFRLETSQNQPIIALLPCTSGDMHRLLFRRLEHGESTFDPDSDHANVLPAFDILDVQFPSDESLPRMSESLRSQLSASSSKPEDIREALNEQPNPQIICSTITNQSGLISRERQQLIDQWIKFWEMIAGKTNSGGPCLNDRVIVIISVVDDPQVRSESSGERSLFSRIFGPKKQALQLPEWVDEWTRRESFFVHFKSFTTLSPVRQPDVEAWLKRIKKHFIQYAKAVDEALIDVPSAVSDAGVPMTVFVESCLNALSIVEKAGKP